MEDDKTVVHIKVCQINVISYQYDANHSHFFLRTAPNSERKTTHHTGFFIKKRYFFQSVWEIFQFEAIMLQIKSAVHDESACFFIKNATTQKLAFWHNKNIMTFIVPPSFSVRSFWNQFFKKNCKKYSFFVKNGKTCAVVEAAPLLIATLMEKIPLPTEKTPILNEKLCIVKHKSRTQPPKKTSIEVETLYFSLRRVYTGNFFKNINWYFYSKSHAKVRNLLKTFSQQQQQNLNDG